MSRSYLQVIAHYYSKPDQSETVANLLGELAIKTRTEPANLYYEFFRSTVDKSHFVILEKYSDPRGLEAHRDTDHFQKIGMQKIIPLLVQREVESYFVDIKT